MTTKRRAVGYVRAETVGSGWSKDRELQIQIIADAAEAKKYDLGDIYTDAETMDIFAPKGTRASQGLADAIAAARECNGVIIFVGLRGYRRNDIFTQTLREMQARKESKGRQDYIEFIECAPTPLLIQALAKSSHSNSKKAKPPRIKHPRRTAADNIKQETETWATKNGISSTKMKGYRHLVSGLEPLHQIFDQHKNLGPQRLADQLNSKGRQTVTGRRWTADSVTRTREIIYGDHYFADFLELWSVISNEQLNLDNYETA